MHAGQHCLVASCEAQGGGGSLLGSRLQTQSAGWLRSVPPRRSLRFLGICNWQLPRICRACGRQPTSPHPCLPHCQVAAGSLVLKPVPPRTLVAGSPAREIGQLTGNPAENMEQWSVSSKELLKSNLESDPFATTSGSKVVPSSDAASSGGDGGGGADAPAEQQSAAAAAAQGAAPAAAAAAAEVVPQRPRDPSADAKAAAQQATAGSKVEAASSEREARRKWGGDMPPPEFII